MLLARGAAREREMALRISLGAGWWRLARQVLTEALFTEGTGLRQEKEKAAADRDGGLSLCAIVP